MAVQTGIEPAISCVTGRHVNRYTTGPFLNFKWWLGTESNRRHKDFQSFALPTELPSLFKMAVQTGIEPAISCVTGRHVNRYTTGPFGCGDRT